MEFVGSVLVLLGAAVWVVYALLRWCLDQEVSIRQFLPYHLAGVLPGFVLKHWHWLKRKFK